MAAELGMSPSYLNHLERNQRPVTAQVLLRLAQAYDVDLKSLTAEGEGTGLEDLAEIFADPMFSDIAIPRYELLEIADNAPSAADAIRASTRRWWSGGTRRRGFPRKPRPRT
jgi:transcriptional regulator with XRE-family HTH domain